MQLRYLLLVLWREDAVCLSSQSRQKSPRIWTTNILTERICFSKHLTTFGPCHRRVDMDILQSDSLWKVAQKPLLKMSSKRRLERELVISLLWSSMTLYYQDNRIPYGLSYQRSQSDMIDQKWLKVLKPIKTCLWTPLIPQFKLIKCHTFPTCVFFRVDHKKLKSQRKLCVPLCWPEMNVFVEWAHRRSQEVVCTHEADTFLVLSSTKN